MIKDTGIRLEDKDRLDVNYAIQLINTSYDLMCNLNGLESKTEDEMREYYMGCALAHVEGRVMLHRLRCELSKKYNIPFDFISRNGDILIEVSNKESENVNS